MHDRTGEDPAERIKRIEAERRARCERLYDIYDTVIIVAGSRSFQDYALFKNLMDLWLKKYYKELGMYCWMSGDAWKGPDAMIKRYAEAHGDHCELMPALWDEYEAIGRKKIAGMKRNHEMGDVATHLVSFWDCVSKGTKDMMDYARSQKLHVTRFLVSPTGV